MARKERPVPKRVFVLPEWDLKNRTKASPLTHIMMERAAASSGFEVIRVNRLSKIPRLLSLMYLPRDSVILTIYPSVFLPILRGGPRSAWRRLLRGVELRIWKRVLKGKRGIVYLYDNPVEQTLSARPDMVIDEGGSRRLERGFLELYDTFLVFGEGHEKLLTKEYGLAGKRFVYYEFSEILFEKNLEKKSSGGGYRIGYVSGAMPKGDWLSELADKLSSTLNIYGRSDDLGRAGRSGIRYMGTLEHRELIGSLNKECEFGLVYYPQNMDAYISTAGTSKLSTYMIAGIPVLYSSKYEHLARMNKKYHIGVEFESLTDVPKILKSLRSEDYSSMAKNCFRVGLLISRGQFTKDAITRSLVARDS